VKRQQCEYHYSKRRKFTISGTGARKDPQLPGEAFGGHMEYWGFLTPPYVSLLMCLLSSLLPQSFVSPVPGDLV